MSVDAPAPASSQPPAAAAADRPAPRSERPARFETFAAERFQNVPLSAPARPTAFSRTAAGPQPAAPGRADEYFNICGPGCISIRRAPPYFSLCGACSR